MNPQIKDTLQTVLFDYQTMKGCKMTKEGIADRIKRLEEAIGLCEREQKQQTENVVSRIKEALIGMVDIFERRISDRPGPDDVAFQWDRSRDAVKLAQKWQIDNDLIIGRQRSDD